MRRRAWAVGVSALVVCLMTLELRLQVGGAAVAADADYAVLILAPAAAAALGLRRGRLLAGRSRASWILLGAASAAWAVGEGVWTWYAKRGGQDIPFPSAADAGYLLFPTLAGAGLLIRPSRAFAGRARARVSLDAALIGVSVFAVLWATTMGAVYRSGADSATAAVIGLAYPASDLALLTVVFVVFIYARSGNRAGLVWIGAGLSAFAIADSGFAYLTAVGKYQDGNLIDAWWVAGFLVLACAALFDGRREERPAEDRPPHSAALLLPYLPAVAGAAAALMRLSNAPGDRLVLLALGLIVLLLIVRQVVVLFDDRRLLALINYRARHDVLTGLANRAMFEDKLSHAVQLRRRDQRPVGLLLIDLDDFKNVNDTMGHPAGDELLRRVGERLAASVRSSDTAARVGGDEFAVLTEDGGNAAALAARILAGLDRPFELAGQHVSAGASIGVTVAGDDCEPTTSTSMMQHADLALYAAKQGGKGTVRTYTPGLARANASYVELRTALAADLAAGALDVAFQPIRAAGGRLFGYEAFARWSHGGEPVPPAQFLPIARRLAASARVDELVLTAALVSAATWDPRLAVSVNIDEQTLADPAIVERVEDLLAETRVDPPRLILEIVDSSPFETDGTALRTLEDLRRRGVRIAVDGFGAGYATLARLHNLQPDIVKIDYQLTASEGQPMTTVPLVERMARFAHQMGSMVIAEQIETRTQLDAAATAGCDAMQGLALGVPSATATGAAATTIDTPPTATRRSPPDSSGAVPWTGRSPVGPRS